MIRKTLGSRKEVKKETNGKAIWYNPTGTIEATFTAKGHVNIELIVLLVLLGLLATGRGGSFDKETKVLGEGKAIAEATCPKCGTPNSSADKFCRNCGAGLGPVPITCSKCAA